MRTEAEKPLGIRILPDILAFGIGLFMAYFMKWETTDLVWSLWLCSLVLGYLTILSVLAGGVCIGLAMLRNKDIKSKHRVWAVLAGIAAGLFFLGFFSLHFCGFHAGHSVFLHAFFPVTGMPDDGFGKAFMNPPLLWILVFRHLIRPYGMFLIPAIIAERHHVFLPLIKALKMVRDMNGEISGKDRTDGSSGKGNNPIGDAMSRPYVNVVRMHLLIFFFAICHALKVDSFLVYAVVYFVYFFPWSEVKGLRPSRWAGCRFG